MGVPSSINGASNHGAPFFCAGHGYLGAEYSLILRFSPVCNPRLSGLRVAKWQVKDAK